ncbi:hypothetical protein DAPPUDRAFT_331466 [Daphnia pulex]|uniref:Tudor domain-containing protein n=1 Tax=Daphnia pulex TaxID=6669 RepID=E9HMJ9_DAPPU|nr:hypothetical protein DAPPUDRAFT_331466 [Daphnia pulex]|eukprot:EFX67044.1 hypothetical protein DAPPUDRAFT_331466 [Daphnia pulex]
MHLDTGKVNYTWNVPQNFLMTASELNSFYRSLLKNELLENCEDQYGQPCVLGEKDETFHRAMFSPDLTTGGDIGVFLVDKGVFHQVKKHRMYRIVPEFITFQALW